MKAYSGLNAGITRKCPRIGSPGGPGGSGAALRRRRDSTALPTKTRSPMAKISRLVGVVNHGKMAMLQVGGSGFGVSGWPTQQHIRHSERATQGQNPHGSGILVPGLFLRNSGFPEWRSKAWWKGGGEPGGVREVCERTSVCAKGVKGVCLVCVLCVCMAMDQPLGSGG